MKQNIHQNKQDTCIYNLMNNYKASTCVTTNQVKK